MGTTTTPVPGGKRIALYRTDGTLACICQVADSFFGRARGLLGRRDLDRGEAMLIQPCWSVHTFFMRFPIDVVFLDERLTVLRVVHGLRPFRGTGRRGARAVLELAAGEVQRLGLSPGEHLGWGEA